MTAAISFPKALEDTINLVDAIIYAALAMSVNGSTILVQIDHLVPDETI